jgi:hypothetical protein
MSVPPSDDRRPTEPTPDEGLWAQVKRQLKASLPTQEELSRHRWLAPVAGRLADRTLWRPKAEPVARGVAIGLFWAFVVPVAQILFAAAHCVWWRGNIPVAAGVTLITNPLTVGGWLWLAYHVGSWLLPASAERVQVTAAGEGWLAWIGSFGLPTLVGMGTFAIAGAALGYVLTLSGARALAWWRMRTAMRRRRDRRRADPAAGSSGGPT